MTEDIKKTPSGKKRRMKDPETQKKNTERNEKQKLKICLKDRCKKGESPT